jgi:hypothetical protein
MRRFLLLLLGLLLLSLESAAQEPVHIDLAGKPIPAIQWGAGSHAVIAIHGSRPGANAAVFGTGLGIVRQ